MGHIFQWPSPTVGYAAQQHRLRALVVRATASMAEALGGQRH
jgi:hypothetical protein